MMYSVLSDMVSTNNSNMGDKTRGSWGFPPNQKGVKYPMLIMLPFIDQKTKGKHKPSHDLNR